MAGIANFRLPPPAKWQDFEDLCADLWRRIWRDANTQKNGRQGQPQNGVDIFGRPDNGALWAGVQCKDKNEDLGSALTEKELLLEIAKAKQFTPKLSAFTIATTGARDATIQERARLLTQEHRKNELFDVAVWCWEDVLARLNDFPEVITLHFPHFRSVHTLESAIAPAEAVGKTAMRLESLLRKRSYHRDTASACCGGRLSLELSKTISAIKAPFFSTRLQATESPYCLAKSTLRTRSGSIVSRKNDNIRASESD